MCLRLDLELTHYLPEARLKLSPPKCWVCTASPYQTSNFLRRFSATHPGRQKNKKWPVVLLLMPSPVQGKAEGLRQRRKPQQHRIEVDVGWGGMTGFYLVLILTPDIGTPSKAPAF